jgi:hypothetical protein
MTVLRFDPGHRSTREAEHWLADLPPVPGLVACTHLVHDDRPRVAVTVATATRTVLPGFPDGVEATDQDGGRAVVYPGVELLTGTMTVADLLAKSAIDRVRVIGGPQPSGETLVDTRDFVRPQWMEGTLTLVATPAADGRIAPFEVPNPTPCCADHG